jgi:protein-S-isoprenylcysteine O-methyltransferase Ste14
MRHRRSGTLRLKPEKRREKMTNEAGTPNRLLVFIYGAAAYFLFLFTFTYAIGFVGNLIVPKSVDSGMPGPVTQSIIINALLLSLFVIQHTIMARPGFKTAWTKIIPEAAERSTFVLLTCAILLLMYWQWRPLPEIVWSIENSAGRFALHGMFVSGWCLVLYSSFLIDHFDLFGLRQVFLFLRGKDYTHPGFAMPWLYKLVRNPLMLGFLLAFWSTPVMSQGRLLFAILTTGYIFVGISFEERDLLRALGEDYRRYRARTPMVIPFLRLGAAKSPAASQA